MSLFGASTPKPNPFGGSLGASTQSSTNLFGRPAASQPQQQGGSLFGTLGQQQTQQQQQPSTGLFGSTTTQQQQLQPQQQSSSLFGSSTQPQQGMGLFGASQQQRPQQGTLFGSQPQPQPQLGGSILGASTVQQLPKLGQSSIWQPPPQGPRDKTIPEQMQILLEKWSPDSSSCQFQSYFYNTVDPGRAPFFGPSPGEDEKKWEEALAKKPNEGAIPVLARGFKAVGTRLNIQMRSVAALQARLHEINQSLAQMLQKHELEFTVKAAEARRRHIALSQRALALATKVQVLRNRGYAMEPAEEELKQKLAQLERQAFDSVLHSRQDEIWSRLMKVRQMASYLQDETERMGKKDSEDEDKIDPETMKKVEKILTDYKSQLDHLEKEVTQIRKDFHAWETTSKPGVHGNARR